MEAQAGFCLRAERKIIPLHPDVRRGLPGLPVYRLWKVARGEVHEGWRGRSKRIILHNLNVVSDFLILTSCVKGFITTFKPGRRETPRLFNFGNGYFSEVLE
jgi:hypothetical protein